MLDCYPTSHKSVPWKAEPFGSLWEKARGMSPLAGCWLLRTQFPDQEVETVRVEEGGRQEVRQAKT